MLSGVDDAISRVIFGTARLSQTEDPMALLDVVWASRVNAFDLARSYGGGESERIMGGWLRSRGIARKAVRLITKGGAGMQPNFHVVTLDEAELEAELKASLAALDVPYVDCFMLHRDNERVDVGRVVRYLNSVVRRGFAKSYGFSNWSFERVVAATASAEAQGLLPPASVGPQFS